ncbi:MAG TPA: uracil-DNA glycosylase family protein [Candidatus Aquilonibacter sp.]|nr:uracil-DNA glycosylase family protein [Candidatus Aquilonibacter sp.]
MEDLPPRLSLTALRKAAAGCHACDLYRYATQTVFGEGKARARYMLVGEQPGDAEDLEGHPFIGPAGRVLHEAMAQAGIDPRDAYVTARRRRARCWVQRFG